VSRPPDRPVSRATSFTSGGHRIDAAVLEPADVRGAAVVAHPHPAHGGHMDHPVVVAVAERAAAAGLLTLRFDFRGVRRSEGHARDVEGHSEDVRRALTEVRTLAPAGPLLGAGFSYGARLMARMAGPDARDRPALSGLLLLAPAVKVPRTARDFGHLLLGRPLSSAARDAPAVEALGRIAVRTRVLVGDRDVVAPVDDLAEALAAPAALEVLEGLNHFFSRGVGASETDMDTLEPAIDKALAALL
jgi:alpha/beta superfamily hydrolase